jgi:hypothetical protein
MSLLLRELEAFVQEHERCGELEGGRRVRPSLDDLYVRRGDQPTSGQWRLVMRPALCEAK